MNSSHNKRKQPEPSNEKQNVTKRQRTMNNMLCEMTEISPENKNNDDDQEDDKNERRDKANCNCKINKASGDEILWVHCGKCFKWFHTIYIPLTNMLEEDLEDYNLTCDSCILQ